MRWRKPLIIVNPLAGRRGSERQVPKELTAFFGRHGVVAVFRTVTRATDARTWAERAGRDGFDIVVVAGGDGTLHEVVAGMEKGKRLPIALLPIGTANVFAGSLGIPKPLKRAVTLLEGGATQSFDLGYSTSHDRYILIALSLGFGAEVSRGAATEMKHLMGFPAYILAALKNLSHITTARFSCDFDGVSRTFRAQTVIVANADISSVLPVRFEPPIRPDDGLLSVIRFDHHTAPELVGVFAGLVVKRKPATTVSSEPVRRLAIQTDLPLPVQIDGEPVATLPLSLSLLPKALTVVVP